MEQKTIYRKNLIGGLTFGIFVWSLFFFTFGCSDSKKSKGSAPYVGAYGYGAPGYGGVGVVTRVGAANDQGGRYTLILAISQNTAVNGYADGSAVVSGELRLRAPIACGANMYVGMNPGVYPLVPASAGPNSFYQLDLLQGVQLVTNMGGLQAVFNVPYTLFTQTNYCGYEGMVGSLDIISINGYPCRTLTGFSDQVGATCG